MRVRPITGAKLSITYRKEREGSDGGGGGGASPTPIPIFSPTPDVLRLRRLQPVLHQRP